MLTNDRYREVVAGAVDAIASAAAGGSLDAPVEHCGDWDVAGLLLHTGGFCQVVAVRVRTGEDWSPDASWRTPPESEVRGDPLGWHVRCGAELIDALANGDPMAPTVTWAGDRLRSFWYRRAAQELTIHRWDAEHATRPGREAVIDADVAADGVDEFLVEFGSRAAPRVSRPGASYQFVSTDSPSYVAHAAMLDDGIDVTYGRLAADVTLTAPAADLLLFAWGRSDASTIAVEGDRALVDAWLDRARI